MSLRLKIVSPEKVEFDGDVESVTVPGQLGRFEVLSNHAPIISSLLDGMVEYKTLSGTYQLNISGGFIEVQKNNVNICVEIAAS
ncbi:MAG: ATP synthase F1 subunit epsilon [Prevotella sp.]|uniref:ATP synthase F1 subunit epsilon n=1 Tax=Prevotella sp. PTAC TaxID=2736295 RepID=UPI0015552616|nr:ATP synthase F1 subunit epsilon [Prevotella sp. PTAC]MCX4292719.1 ATP synthase F1 subunit epsilon [Prevotella sp.]NPD53246.1 ATP synthase F1 subunit epsilon [Prevotella sp. PTAC]